MKRLLLMPLLLSLGCAGALQDIVRKQAAFDHRCPLEKTAVTGVGPDGLSMRLNVCGEERVYHDGGTSPVWAEQPDAAAKCATSPSP